MARNDSKGIDLNRLDPDLIICSSDIFSGVAAIT
jgi:hypothetical protein